MILLDLFLTFFKIGAFTFGGGYAMLPLIQEEVLSKSWISNQELIDFIAISESTPGPFAVNISTYVGMTVGGVPGALASTFGVVLPSFIIILLLAKSYKKYSKSKIVAACMFGLKSAVVGLIAAALLSVAESVLLESDFKSVVIDQRCVISIGIFLLMAILAFKKIHPVFIICLSALAGIFFVL